MTKLEIELYESKEGVDLAAREWQSNLYWNTLLNFAEGVDKKTMIISANKRLVEEYPETGRRQNLLQYSGNLDDGLLVSDSLSDLLDSNSDKIYSPRKVGRSADNRTKLPMSKEEILNSQI